MRNADKIKAWNLVEKLRAPEGHAVTLICDNPDFNEQPNSAIEVVGEWTRWEPMRFTGDTMLAALENAYRASTIIGVTTDLEDYTVGTTSGGNRVWWSNWQMAHSDMSGYRDVRPASHEESALMDKVVWDTDTFEDRERLRDMIKSR